MGFPEHGGVDIVQLRKKIWCRDTSDSKCESRRKNDGYFTKRDVEN
jgi:hypothetical protein